MGKKGKEGRAAISSLLPCLCFGAVISLSFGWAGPAQGQAYEVLEVNGNCNSDSRLDISDCIFLLSYLFTGGGPPQCEERCEFNHDGGLNIADAIGLLDYFMMGIGTSGPLVEVCDGIDNNCDGVVDEGCPTQIDLLWNKVTKDVKNHPETVSGYRIYVGTTGLDEDYSMVKEVGPDCGCASLEKEVLPARTARTLYLAVTAFDQAGNESAFSSTLQITW